MGTNNTYTIQEAIQKWYKTTDGNPVRITDNCQGPHCNDACPEMFILDDINSNSWLPSLKVILVLIILCVASACICAKVVFMVWLWRLEWKQQLYLGLLGDESYTADIEHALQVKSNNN